MSGRLSDYLFHQEPGITLYCGDCREVLPLLECSVYGALVTDPPYGHADRWQGGTWGAAPMYADAQRWDAQTFDAGFLLEVVRRSSSAIVWGGNYYPMPPSRCWLAWQKSSPMPTLADFELAWTSLDRPSKLFLEDRNPDGPRLHPTQKPLSLMTWCLAFASGDVVTDPFCGSGTTLEAAKLLNRPAIGIEIEPKYCEIAVKRLRQEVLAFSEQAAYRL